jgi:hypothetical protein
MKGFVSYGVKYFIGAGVVGSLLLTQGCIDARLGQGTDGSAGG